MTEENLKTAGNTMVRAIKDLNAGVEREKIGKERRKAMLEL